MTDISEVSMLSWIFLRSKTRGCINWPRSFAVRIRPDPTWRRKRWIVSHVTWFSAANDDDHVALAQGMVIYDAFYS